MSAPIKRKTLMNPSGVDEDFSKPSTQDEMPTTTVPVVRTLKPPPEIWELVHPVPPRQFTPTRAFIGRLVSSRSVFIFLAGMVVFIGVYIGLRSGHRIASVTNNQVQPAKRVDSKKAGVGASNTATVEQNVPVSEEALPLSQPTDVGASAKLRRTPSRRGSKPIEAVTQVDNGPAGTQTTTDSKPDSPLQSPQLSSPTNAAEAAKVGSAASVSAERKSKTTLSPQLIEAPKTSTPRKAKVIQWP
jgi:hypothetical protein